MILQRVWGADFDTLSTEQAITNTVKDLKNLQKSNNLERCFKENGIVKQ